MPRSSVQLTVSLPPELYKRAMQVAKREIRSKSELVREALRVYILQKQDISDARKALAAQLERAGARSLEDIERMVDEGRA